MQKRAGFTLIELVVVIAILGILAGIAIPRFMDSQASARGAKIVADLRTMDSALSLYLLNNTITSNKMDEEITPSMLVPKYLAAIPAIPQGKAIFPNGLTINIGNNSKYVVHYRAADKSSRMSLSYISTTGGFSAGTLTVEELTDKLTEPS